MVSTPKGPFFVVGTSQEAEAVSLLGFDVISASGKDAADVALSMRDGGSGTAILSMSDEAVDEWAGAMRAAGVPWRSFFDMREYFDGAGGIAEGKGTEMLLRLNDEVEAAKKVEEQRRAEAIDTMLTDLHAHDVTGVAMEIFAQTVHSEPTPTGLESFDEATGGGLPQGALTVLGAGSSSGKTTLATQWADSIAAAGRPVLFVTIEQSRHEIVAKSLSRMMRQTEKPNGGWYVASTSHILSKRQRATWPKDKEEALLSCCDRYTRTVAPYLRIMEMDGQPSVLDVRKAAEAMARSYGQAPTILIDYLQLMRAKDDRMDTRRAIDLNVMALRQMAREMKTSVVVISSINRSSYTEGADMSMFKESGSIEFSADLALILQPRGWAEKVEASSEKQGKEKARKAMAEHKGSHIRQSEIVVLKNRGGQTPKDPVPLEYDAMCNLFTDGAPTPQKKKVVL